MDEENIPDENLSQESNTEEKGNSNNWLWVIFILIIGLILYFAKYKVKKANESLQEHLEDKNKALNDIYLNIGYYRKRKVEILFAKKQTTWFLRYFVSTVLLVLNAFYINLCYSDITIQHICEGIATFNAALLFLTGIFAFAVFGSFFEIRTVYHSFQTYTLSLLFKRSEETIENLQRLDLNNREAIRKEIDETTNAIKQNEELLNQSDSNWDFTGTDVNVIIPD
ncbi:MAG: hypothetical protein WC716_16245 [Chitinophagaceae bacterium]|jgi:hypothetical protein